MLKERADSFQKSLITLNIKSEGKLAISEIYQLPYLLREEYVKTFNEYQDEKNKAFEELNA